MLEIMKKNTDFLTDEEICEMAVARIKNEYEDLKTYKGTEIFTRLLGIYNAKKDEKVNKSEIYNSGMANYGLIVAEGIASEVANTLITFCQQNVYFANLVLRNNGSFTSCLAYTIHGFMSKDDKKKAAHLSDIKTYRRAVEYYSSSGSVQFVMNIELPEIAFEPITKADVDVITENYENSKVLANAELEAKAKAEAERKAKAEAEQKAREEKERKKKEREAKKKAEEKARKEFEKAQISFLADEPDETVSAPTPVKKKSTPVQSAFSTPVEKNETEKKDNIIQLTLF